MESITNWNQTQNKTHRYPCLKICSHFYVGLAEVEDVSIRRIRSSPNGINHWNQSNGQGEGRRVGVSKLNHSKIANINVDADILYH